MGRTHFIRNLEAWAYVEIFLVAAVTTVLGVRLFLDLTGYPQLGVRGLHIAHMLWGGLLMLAALIILLSFLSKAAHRTAALIGGAGFGLFIDEIGKFVTRDHNYFFAPAPALIYAAFILTLLAVHGIRAARGYSEQEYLMNALRQMEEVALHDLTEEERDRALWYLERSDPSHPLVAALRQLIERAVLVPPRPPSWFARSKRALATAYRRISRLPGFTAGVVGLFLFQLGASLVYAIVLVFFVGLGWESLQNMRVFGAAAVRLEHLTFPDAAQLASSAAAGVFTLLGVMRIRRSRLAAFAMFERSALISIFLTQFFSFYKEQFSALAGLLLNVLILIAVRFVMEQEHVAAHERARQRP
jgi:hypothetical protein